MGRLSHDDTCCGPRLHRSPVPRVTPGSSRPLCIHGPSGVSLIDPGPSTSLDHLRAALKTKGMAIGDVRQVLLTHIHLDHAGAHGIARQGEPGDRRLGPRSGCAPSHRSRRSCWRAPHGCISRTWIGSGGNSSRCRPIAFARCRAANGFWRRAASWPSPTRQATRRTTSATSTRASRVAFVGDTAGIRRGAGSYVLPPTPPPDIDLEAWRESERRILAWDPETLFSHAFRPLSRCPRALPAAVRPPGRLERDRPPAPRRRCADRRPARGRASSKRRSRTCDEQLARRRPRDIVAPGGSIIPGRVLPGTGARRPKGRRPPEELARRLDPAFARRAPP